MGVDRWFSGVMGFCLQQQDPLFPADLCSCQATLAEIGSKAGRDECPALHGAPTHPCTVTGVPGALLEPAGLAAVSEPFPRSIL